MCHVLPCWLFEHWEAVLTALVIVAVLTAYTGFRVALALWRRTVERRSGRRG